MRCSLILAAFCAALATFTGGCGRGQYSTVYVFIDVTDSVFRSPPYYVSDVRLILRDIQIDTVRGTPDGGEIRFFLINDLSQSRSAGRRLPAAARGPFAQNRLVRLDQAKAFVRDVWRDLDSVLGNTRWERGQSKIYQHLCRALNQLKSATSDRRIAVVYSDMLENSTLFSFYGSRADTVRQYIQDIDRLRLGVQTDCELVDLRGVDVNVVTLRKRENDEKVNLASRFWMRLLEHRNATVRFGAELRLTPPVR